MSDSPSAASAVDNSVKTFTTSERIAELNEIDKTVATLLASAAEAVGVLSNRNEDGSHPPTDLETAQTRFTKASSNYFATLSSIEVRLRRQVYALEEAGLIEAGTERDAKAGAEMGRDGVGRAGGGPLDTSWLNAKASNAVERRMEQDTLKEAQEFLEAQRQKNGQAG